MTQHLSNFNANPRRLSRKDKKRIHRASQMPHLPPMKKSGYGSGYVSSFNKFMREFNKSQDKCPSTFESMRAVHVLSEEEVLNPETGKLETISYWSQPQECPRKSQTAGLGHVTLAKAEKITAATRARYGDPREKQRMNEMLAHKDTEKGKEQKHTVDFASN